MMTRNRWLVIAVVLLVMMFSILAGLVVPEICARPTSTPTPRVPGDEDYLQLFPFVAGAEKYEITFPFVARNARLPIDRDFVQLFPFVAGPEEYKLYFPFVARNVRLP